MRTVEELELIVESKKSELRKHNLKTERLENELEDWEEELNTAKKAKADNAPIERNKRYDVNGETLGLHQLVKAIKGLKVGEALLYHVNEQTAVMVNTGTVAYDFYEGSTEYRDVEDLANTAADWDAIEWFEIKGAI